MTVIEDSGRQGSGPSGASVIDNRLVVSLGPRDPNLPASFERVRVINELANDLLNANANIQVGDVDASAGNPVPVTLIDPEIFVNNDFLDPIPTIDQPHSQIHAQNFFSAQSFTLALLFGAFDDIHILTGDLPVHMQFSVKARQDVQVQLFEAPTTTVAGAAVASVCRNRITPVPAAQTVITLNPTVTVTGTPLVNGWVGGNLLAGFNPPQDVTGMAGAWSEWIFEPNTEYLLRVTNALVAVTTLTQETLNWYESLV